MNIFYLDRDIEKNVQYHCDKHVVKMILESAQLLSSVHHMTNEVPPLSVYKLTHKNHPCAIWARSSLANYEYLFALTVLLNDEYRFRYSKKFDHKSMSIVQDMPIPNLPDLPFTEPPKCVHDDFKDIDDVVDAYRAYYKRDKASFCTWTNREIPEWFR